MNQVNAHDDDDPNSHPSNPSANLAPSSPPPSFHSRSSSPSSRRLLHDGSRGGGRSNEADQALADAFDDGSDSEADDEPDDRQRLMRANPEPRSLADGDNGGYGEGSEGNNTAASSSQAGQGGQRPQPQQQQQLQLRQQQRQGRGLFRSTTILPSFLTSSSGTARAVTSSNDGVFANLAAKPERGESKEDLPPVRICVSCIVVWRLDVSMLT